MNEKILPYIVPVILLVIYCLVYFALKGNKKFGSLAASRESQIAKIVFVALAAIYFSIKPIQHLIDYRSAPNGVALFASILGVLFFGFGGAYYVYSGIKKLRNG